MTKKCKSCQIDIDAKAKKCPHCQTDQRNWFLRHPIMTGFLVLFVLLLIGGASSQKNIPSKVGDTMKDTGSSNQAAKMKTFKIGDQVDLQGKTLTVNSVTPYQPSNQFMQPKAGNKVVAIDVSLKNSSQEPFNYNVLDFRLQDDKDYTYSNSISDKEPYLTTGALQPGQTTRGFITYELPADNTAAKVVFTPSFLGTEQIIIDLE